MELCIKFSYYICIILIYQQSFVIISIRYYFCYLYLKNNKNECGTFTVLAIVVVHKQLLGLAYGNDGQAIQLYNTFCASV